MRKFKIIVPIVLLTLLFVISFLLQSKFNSIVLNNGESVEGLVSKQFMVLGTSFAFINTLIASIGVCVVSMFIILIFVLVNRRKMESRAKSKEKLTETYQALIFDALEDKVMDENEMKQFKKICNNRFKKGILIDQIIDVALMMPNDLISILRKLYFDLGLMKETKRKLYSRHWHHRIKAMKELSHLDIKTHNGRIMKYINAKNDTVRMEARIAMVRLSDDENPLMFLEHLDHEFSPWEQITLHQLLVEADIKVPNFAMWLFSDNYSVGSFCLKMIREYNQVENTEWLEKMLFHPDKDVTNLAIEVVGDLKIESLAGVLKKRYKEESYTNGLEIVKSLGKIANPNSVKFLQHVVDSEADTQLQIEGVKAINNMGEIGKTFLKKMMDSEYKDYNIIIKHVLDNRIN